MRKLARHISCTYAQYTQKTKFINFVLVGGSSATVDIVIYWLLQFVFFLDHVTSKAISFWPGTAWGWFWNRNITFRGRHEYPKLRQLFYFTAACLTSFGINFGVYYHLTMHTDFFFTYKILAIVVAALVGLAFNYSLSSLLVFPERKKPL